jgi:hypothetical protein
MASPEAVRITCSAFGVRIGLETTPAILQQVSLPLVAGGHEEPSGQADLLFTLSEINASAESPTYKTSDYKVVGTDGTLAFEAGLDNAVQSLRRRAEEFVAESATEFVFVHAGAVAWKGRAILIPGQTFTGKSTLVMALVRAGATYLSDEYAVINRAGQVHPFARRPRLRGASEREEGFSALTFVNSQARSALPVGLVLKTTYQADAKWRPNPLTAGETLLALLENTVAVRSQAEVTVTVLKELMLSARGMKTARPEAEAIAGQILQLADEWRDTSTNKSEPKG